MKRQIVFIVQRIGNRFPWFRRIVVWIYDTISRAQWKKFVQVGPLSLAVPSRHDLTEIKYYLAGCSGLGILAGICFSDSKNHYVDLGANVGDTAAIIEVSSQTRLHSTLVEPSEFFLRYLRLNSKNYHRPKLINSYAASSYPPKPIQGKLMHWAGNAEIVSKGRGRNLAEAHEQVLLAELIAPKTALVKIDCEGEDMSILRTALSPGLELHARPWIYMEVTLQDAAHVLEFKSLILDASRYYSSAFAIFRGVRYRVFPNLQHFEKWAIEEWSELDSPSRRHFQFDLILVPKGEVQETQLQKKFQASELVLES